MLISGWYISHLLQLVGFFSFSFFGLFFFSWGLFIEETRLFVLWFPHNLDYASCVPILSFNVDVLKLWNYFLAPLFSLLSWNWLFLEFCFGAVMGYLWRVEFGHRTGISYSDEAQSSVLCFEDLFIYFCKESERVGGSRGRGGESKQTALSTSYSGLDLTIPRSWTEPKPRVGGLTDWATQVPVCVVFWHPC